ncbi:MAG: malonyl-ACP O-methyltransferase BioC [Candidatus Delongbacteria bacterium]|nr:malonyl-ACP O-methyltransferase BioC [Candidatus Delongbacteria bacterium]MBN2835347.1 malonyl-ACP O-methyltransferase BioC [Candidatus Delongbacteria bacterium]
MLKEYFKIDKELVKTKFQNCLETYHDEAIVQKKIAENLFFMINEKIQQADRILEIGCGSGFLTDKLVKSFPESFFFINDIVDEYINVVERLNNKKMMYICEDMDIMEIPENLDLVVSASAIQWSDDLAKLISRVSKKLRKGGYFIFSSFGFRNFYQISDLAESSLKYFSRDELEEMMSDFTNFEYSCEEITIYFDKAIDILRHQKNTGVNALPLKEMNAGKLMKFLREYEQKYSSVDGVPLTYNPIYIAARKND